jgi:predicted RNA binding protein YcfA (HicA-like mRNA interferase family)
VVRLRRLSGQELLAAFARLGFRIHSQKGSHVKPRRVTDSGERQTLTVPLHRELDTGTCRAILRQASRYVPVEDLRPLFYPED